MALICLLRYGQLLEQSRHSWVNTTTLITGCTNAAGLVVVGNFQVRPHAHLLNFPEGGQAFGRGPQFPEGGPRLRGLPLKVGGGKNRAQEGKSPGGRDGGGWRGAASRVSPSLRAQVDHAKSLHYVGTGVAFTAGLLFVCLHCALSYHGATAPQDLAVAYLRIVLAAIAFVSLILSILPGQGGQELLL